MVVIVKHLIHNQNTLRMHVLAVPAMLLAGALQTSALQASTLEASTLEASVLQARSLQASALQASVLQGVFYRPVRFKQSSTGQHARGYIPSMFISVRRYQQYLLHYKPAHAAHKLVLMQRVQ